MCPLRNLVWKWYSAGCCWINNKTMCCYLLKGQKMKGFLLGILEADQTSQKLRAKKGPWKKEEYQSYNKDEEWLGFLLFSIHSPGMYLLRWLLSSFHAKINIKLKKMQIPVSLFWKNVKLLWVKNITLIWVELSN